MIAVFQPHLYSRTATFAAEFAAALDGADEVVVLDVYGAREEPLDGVTGRTIAEELAELARRLDGGDVDDALAVEARQKLGQPLPESNLWSDLNSSALQHTQR